MHCGYVVKVTELRKHTNADRLQIATFFGNDTIVDLSVKVGDIGVYFPVDLQLSADYCVRNKLVRMKDAQGNEVGGFLDPEKRNIKAIKLRGEKSDGLYMPLSSFNDYYGPTEEPHEYLNVGDQITIINGHPICCKYIPKTSNRVGKVTDGNKTRKKKVPVAPLFKEHADTEQLAYNLGAFRVDDIVEITLKMHGTSQRTGRLPVLKKYKRTLLDKLLKREGKPIYEWDYITGTRRVVLDKIDGTGGYYDSNNFRKDHHDALIGKLEKGETVYYEVVGFTGPNAPIMANGDNKKVDKEFVKQYGPTTVFSYGCSDTGKVSKYGKDDTGHFELVENVPVSDMYVYRMTMTNEDGFVVEYTPDFMRYRCEQMGVKCVPVFWRGVVPDEENACRTNDDGEIEWFCDPGTYVKDKAEEFYDGPDPVGKTHVREGVVCRIINRPKFAAFKHKNFSFKVLEGIICESVAEDSTTDPDILSEL